MKQDRIIINFHGLLTATALLSHRDKILVECVAAEASPVRTIYFIEYLSTPWFVETGTTAGCISKKGDPEAIFLFLS
jgi:hypothetical protein